MPDERPVVNSAAVVARGPDIAFVEIDGETVAYDPQSELLHHLDAIATAVWRCLDGSRSITDVVATLVHDFSADPARVERDVLELVDRLAADGLVVTPPTP